MALTVLRIWIVTSWISLATKKSLVSLYVEMCFNISNKLFSWHPCESKFINRHRAVCLCADSKEANLKVLILSCNTGQGHNSAGKALFECFTHSGIPCEMKDALSFAGGKGLPSCIQRLYQYGNSCTQSIPLSICGRRLGEHFTLQIARLSGKCQLYRCPASVHLLEQGV